MSSVWKKPRRDDDDKPDPERALRELADLRAETERVKSETQEYATLGREIRGIRQKNHLAEAFRAAARGRAHG